jgi:hypothetical protein
VIELVALQAVAGIEVTELPGLWIELGQAAVAAEPDAALIVDQHGVDDVAQETLSFGEAGEIGAPYLPVSGRPEVDTTTLSADPEIALSVFGDGPWMVATQTL